MNSKATQERHQRILLDLVRQPGNQTCADCGGRAPRWASWNLGIFLCVQCAGVHRKMGTHISKVKSLSLDTWTREQVDKMKEIGNVKSNKMYNPDVMRNRPPTNMEESERNSELEKFIRRKYEFRRFMDSKPPPVPSKDATFLKIPPSSSSSSLNDQRRVSGGQASLCSVSSSLTSGDGISRSRTAPIPNSWAEAQHRARSTEPKTPVPSLPTGTTASALGPPSAVPPRASSAVAASNPTANSSVFDDLISLNDPQSAAQQMQPSLQMNPWALMQVQQQQVLSTPAVQEPQGNFWAGQTPMQTQQATGFVSAFSRAPQHANTLPDFSVTSPMGFAQPMYSGLDNGGLSPQYQQQRSASLGTMAFSPGTSPMSNPFASGGMTQQQTGFGQQQNGYLGQSPSPSPTPALRMRIGMMQQQQQPQQSPQQPNGSPFGNFASNMMPSQQGHNPGMYQQQQQQQQMNGSYAVQAGQQAFGQGQNGGGYWG